MQTVYSFLQNNALYLIVGGTNGDWAHMRTKQTVRGFLQSMTKFEFVPLSMLRKLRGKLANGVGLPCNYDLYHIVCHQTEVQSTREICKRCRASSQLRFVPHTLCCEMYVGNLQTVWGFREFTILYLTICHRTGVQSTRKHMLHNLHHNWKKRVGLPEGYALPDQNSHKTHASQLTLHLETDWPVSF